MTQGLASPLFWGENWGSASLSTLPYLTQCNAVGWLQSPSLSPLGSWEKIMHFISMVPQAKDSMYIAVLDLSFWKMRLFKRGKFQQLRSLILRRTPVCERISGPAGANSRLWLEQVILLNPILVLWCFGFRRWIRAGVTVQLLPLKLSPRKMDLYPKWNQNMSPSNETHC